MTTATIVHEPLLRRAWRMDGNLRYEVAMYIIIIILNVAAILHITIHKISIDDDGSVFPVIALSFMYATAIMLSCMFWYFACEDDSMLCETYFMGRLGHTVGFCNFLFLLYSISHLALYISLSCLLWFVPAVFAPFCPCLWRGEPAWWNFVKQPDQSTVSIV